MEGEQSGLVEEIRETSGGIREADRSSGRAGEEGGETGTRNLMAYENLDRGEFQEMLVHLSERVKSLELKVLDLMYWKMKLEKEAAGE